MNLTLTIILGVLFWLVIAGRLITGAVFAFQDGRWFATVGGIFAVVFAIFALYGAWKTPSSIVERSVRF